MKTILLALFLFSALAACQAPATQSPTLATSTSVPAPLPISTLVSATPIGQNAISILARVSPVRPAVGEIAKVQFEFQPVVYSVTFKPDGSILAASALLSDSATVAEMQFCFAPGTCALSGQWVRYSATTEVPLRADWLGVRDFQFQAQFRDANGKIIPAYRDAYVGPKETTAWSLNIESAYDERTPIASLPPTIQTAVAATRVASPALPITGTVKILGGAPITGATAGDTLRVSVTFSATSTAGTVKEMRITAYRVKRCATEAEMLDAAWEPLVAEKIYTVTVPINFSSFDVSAQYRDALGNLSRVACADLIIEGMPPLTPSRTP